MQIIAIGWGKGKDLNVKVLTQAPTAKSLVDRMAGPSLNPRSSWKVCRRHKEQLLIDATCSMKFSTFSSLWTTYVTATASEWMREMDRHVGMT